MTVLVVNCFDWIGFHLVNELIQDGYDIDGLDTVARPNKEHLSMYLGRSSRFTEVKKCDVKQYSVAIIIGEYKQSKAIQAERIITIQMTHSNGEEQQVGTTIKPAFLFGEWMLMDEQGVYNNRRYYSFFKPKFEEAAIYIKDFTEIMLQLLQEKKLPSTLDIRSEKEKMESVQDQSIYIREKTAIHLTIKKLIKHYKRFKEFYP